ncbi:MAG: 16S rRNA (adenine(1518)-N(6)/adenine(1519)-N(6))-dimethyltransferase RsmA [Chloroflexi bacterium]|nr:16S rRNA (adenine(1518)-N(6)/adenine(1519)-N(6))-dimethyltransferase RsmA [Chloroflexota bacterium]
MKEKRKYPKKDPLLTETRDLLRQLGIRPRKGLGQHFLIDKEALSTIMEAAELTRADVVLEVGPGLGILTRELAQRAGWVIAIELDDKLAAMLQQRLVTLPNVTIINRNILDIDPAALLNEQQVSFSPSLNPLAYKVVANLPYSITSPVLRHFLEASRKPEFMVVMVQKEVAQAIVAEPGERSILSISVQFYGKPRIVSHVPARSFYPAPEVDSAILRIDIYPKPVVAVTDEASFFRLVRAGFSAARKQLVNSLSQGMALPRERAFRLLDKAGIQSQRRAETLTLEEWARLWQVYVSEK